MDHCRGGSIPRDPPRDDGTTRNTPRGCGAGQGPFMSGDAPRGPAKDGGPSRAIPGVVVFPGSHLGTVLCPEGLSQMRWRPQRHLQGLVFPNALLGPAASPWTIVGAAASPETLQGTTARPGTLPEAVAPAGTFHERDTFRVSDALRDPPGKVVHTRGPPRGGGAPRGPSRVIGSSRCSAKRFGSPRDGCTPRGLITVSYRRSGVPKGPPRGGGAPMDHCRGGSIPRDPPRDDSTTRNTPRGCGARQGPFMSGDAPRGPAKDGGPSRAVPAVMAFPGSHLGTVLCPEGLSQMRWRPQRHLQGPYRSGVPKGPPRDGGVPMDHCRGGSIPRDPPRDDGTTRNTPRGCGAGQGPFMSGDAPRAPAKYGGPSRAVPGVVAFPGSHLGTVLCPEGLSQMRWRPQRHLQGQRCPQGPSTESGPYRSGVRSSPPRGGGAPMDHCRGGPSPGTLQGTTARPGTLPEAVAGQGPWRWPWEKLLQNMVALQGRPRVWWHSQVPHLGTVLCPEGLSPDAVAPQRHLQGQRCPQGPSRGKCGGAPRDTFRVSDALQGISSRESGASGSSTVVVPQGPFQGHWFPLVFQPRLWLPKGPFQGQLRPRGADHSVYRRGGGVPWTIVGAAASPEGPSKEGRQHDQEHSQRLWRRAGAFHGRLTPPGVLQRWWPSGPVPEMVAFPGSHLGTVLCPSDSPKCGGAPETPSGSA
ncbi:collagen alpha-1(III) chain-like [Homarus americanus]|uniref:collagen alpha-1(III) chain-like n=1 Tax=Homarus americanus TaxID=6706 RepID=UPI001C45147D|nr:collagen alpha-1(III) chain-like [Homarus americanus]